MNSCSHFDVPVRVSPQVRPGGEQRRCRSSPSARGWSPRAFRARSTDYARASARPTASVTPCTRPPLHFVCRGASHRSTFASRSWHPGGESVLLARRMAAGVMWMTADARADARGHAAHERERTGGAALERRPAVVGHRWPSAAGPDEPAPAWQVVYAGLRVRQGLCAAWWRACARWALRWRRRRRRRRVGDARVRRLAECSSVCMCDCTSKNRFAPDFCASDCVCIRHIFDTNIHLTLMTSTDRLTHVPTHTSLSTAMST